MRIILTISLCCLCISFANAQSSKYFKKNYGDLYPWVEDGLFIQVLSDGYLTGGDRFHNSILESDYNIIKVNKFGDVINQFINIDSTSNCVISDALNLNNAWVFAGGWEDNIQNLGQTYVLKTDTIGNVIWEKFIGDTLDENLAYCISKTIDNGFILGGLLVSQITGKYEGTLTKLDSSGNEQWTRAYPGLIANNIIYHVEQNADSTYTFIGGKDLYIYNGDIWMVHTDINGFEISSNIYEFVTVPNSDFNVGNHFAKTSDNGYVISGTTGFLGGFIRGIIFKIDSTGQIVWEKVMSQFPDGSGNPWISEILKSVVLSDQSVVSAGSISVYANGNLQLRALLIKVDSTGTELWRRVYAYNNQADTYGYAMEATPDGGFIIAGRAEGPNIGADLYLIKTNCLGFWQAPKADFSVIWNGSTATFYNLSGRADTCIYYFGDGDSSVVLLTDTTPVVHTYAGSGPYTPYLLAYACGEIDTLYQTIYTGINNEYELIEKSFTIFPNPAAEKITLSCIIPSNLTEVNLLITDLTGRVISSNQIQGNPRELEIDISYLNNGSYLVNLEHNGNILASRKLMVVK